MTAEKIYTLCAKIVEKIELVNVVLFIYHQGSTNTYKKYSNIKTTLYKYHKQTKKKHANYHLSPVESHENQDYSRFSAEAR